MKKGLFKYFQIAICLFACATVFVVILSFLATFITNKANEHYMPKYQSAEKGYSSPWYENGLHIVDEGFIDQISEMKNNPNRVIALGSSLSRISFQNSLEDLENGYKYFFCVCGNGCYRSDRVFLNLLEAENLINKDTIVKYEISFSTFRNTSMTIAESSIDKWGAYTVNDDLAVKKCLPLFAPITELNKCLLKIQNVGELIFTENNFCNNYFNYEAVAASCGMNDDMKSSVKADLDKINSEAICVVELTAIPQGLKDTEYGQELEEYIDSELIPFLDSKGIEYLDYRDCYSDEQFADGVHLSYNAGIDYTKMLNEDINRIISEVK